MANASDGNVIHVDFSVKARRRRRPRRAPKPRRGHLVEPDAAPLPFPYAASRADAAQEKTAEDVDADGAEDAGAAEVLAALYTRQQAARLVGVSPARLRTWERRALVVPSTVVGRRKRYTFQDLISLRSAHSLLQRGVPFQTVLTNLEQLRERLPTQDNPLSALSFVVEGKRLIVRDVRGSFEPLSGQSVIDFSVQRACDDVVRALSSVSSEVTRKRAYDSYLEGCRFDEDETTFARAEAAYLRALKLDPTLANALTNLGNLRYRQERFEEAAGLYREALVLDAEQPEALYNLGFLSLEDGDAATAVTWFQKALDADPSFADAHFNLAMALEESQREAQAIVHWRAYLRLEREGPWADAARHRLRNRAVPILE
ncbi:MAG: tetratricopeptide repeat protein [Polyangiales bacterium]